MVASQSNLSAYGYDFVVATTQDSLNATMKEYLSKGGEPEVAICYIADQHGNPTAIDYAQLKQSAHGSDPFAVPADADPAKSQDLKNLFEARFMVGFKAKIGLPPGYAPTAIPDVVGLGADASSVSYTLMCSEFVIVHLQPGSGYDPTPSWMKVSQPPGKAWLFTSKVDIRLAPYGDAYSKLPPSVQAAIKDLGDEAFSVQQLLFDLDTAALQSVPQIGGVDPGTDPYACLQKDFLGAYFNTVKQKGQPVLGYVTPRSKASGAEPKSSLTLTDFDFQVSPFLGSDNQPVNNPTPAQQNLVTLNYLCAAGGTPLPGPGRFRWNWMEPGDEADFDGVLSINRNALVRYFDPLLLSFCQKTCYQPRAQVTLDNLSRPQFRLDMSPGQMPTVTRPPTGASVLSYAYSSASSDVAGLNGDLGQLEARYYYTLDVSFSDNKIVITQNSNLWLRIQKLATSTSGNIYAVTVVDTYTIDVDENGRLVANLKSDRTDHTDNLEVNAFVNFFTGENELVDNYRNWAQKFISSNVQDVPLSIAQSFVFPGGKTFVFKDACFSAHQDLVAHITYADPTMSKRPSTTPASTVPAPKAPAPTITAPTTPHDAEFTPVYQQGDPGAGIGDYDLKSPQDRVFAFDYQKTGRLDHLVAYRPGTGTVFILRNGSGKFIPVYQQGDPGAGIGGYDLKSPQDRVFAFDYQQTGRLDHLVAYRPGAGTIFILRNDNGKFTPVYEATGIGDYDLKSPQDRVFAFDYQKTGRLDHLVAYRSGTGTIFILRNGSGGFTPVYHGTGIGDYDLKSPEDRLFAFDYQKTGRLDHLVAYRPGRGAIFILRNDNGKFTPVYHQGDPGNGIGGWNLQSPQDRLFALDYQKTGRLDHLVAYRPGRGAIFILRNDNGSFTPVYQQGDPGSGIGDYDLKSPQDRLFAFDYQQTGRLDHLVAYRPGRGAIFLLRNDSVTSTPVPQPGGPGSGTSTPVQQQGGPGTGTGGGDSKGPQAGAMKITFESELMENRKHATVMAPDQKLEALQTSDGGSLFFSIGDDGVFYLTQEVGGSRTGWNRLDLSSALSQQHGGAKVVAKTFDVSQNAQTGAIDLALVATINGSDTLYLSRGNANLVASWAKGVSWSAVPFDDAAHPMPALQIADVYIEQTQTGEYFVADILKEPGNPLNPLFRYYLTPEPAQGGKHWNPHDLSADLAGGSISSLLGQRTGDTVAGIYTFGTIGGRQELMYTPLYNPFNPAHPASPSRLAVPDGASAIATTVGADGTTSLFVAGQGVLTFFAPDNQSDGAAGVPIVTHRLFAGVQHLEAFATETVTTVWAVNQPGDLFYVTCKAGQEATPAAWSVPVPILANVEQIAPYLNQKRNNAVIFAHVSGETLVQLTQDPVTTAWQQRRILLPSTDAKDVVKFQSYTTHVTVTDDHNMPAPNTALRVTSTSPVSAYLNDVYHLLSPDVPVNTATDVTGVLTIVQETHGLGAVCFKLVLAESGVTAAINPMTKVVDKLNGVDDVGQVQVTNADGTQQKLVPADVSPDDVKATTASLKQFTQTAGQMPADGTLRKPATENAVAAVGARPATTPSSQVWGMSFHGDGWTYHEGEAAAQRFGLRGSNAASPALNQARPAIATAAAPTDLGTAIEVLAGDIWNWLKSAWESVEHFFVQVAEDVYHFFIQIAGELYHFVLDCVHAVVQAVEFIFNKIKTFFEDLIKWLGFLFQWADIIRTHNVLKNLFAQYAAHAIASLGPTRAKLHDLFVGLEHKINAWASIPDIQTSIGSYHASAPPLPGQTSPQANFGVHHTKGNLPSLAMNYTPPSSGGEDLLSSLGDTVEKEVEAFQTAIEQIKSQIVDKFTQLSPTDIIKKLVAIIGDLLLNTVENILDEALRVVEILAKGVLAAFEAPISIPILSDLYRDITGNDLSMLDLVCLVVAIPVTLIYKLVTNEAPFPDNATTQALINAQDFTGIQHALGFSDAASPAPRLAGARSLSAAATPAVPPGPPTPIGTKAADIMTFVFNISGGVGAILVSVASGLKRLEGDAAALNRPLCGFAATAYLPYIAPNINSATNPTKAGEWYNALNIGVTSFSFVKTVVDNVTEAATTDLWKKASPWLELIINATWLAPAIGAMIFDPAHPHPDEFPKQDYDWVGFAGNAAFDVGGILTPWTDKEFGGDAAPVIFGITIFLTIAYGVLIATSGGLQFRAAAKKWNPPLNLP